MHGIHHEPQGGINNATRLFRIEIFDEGRGALEVSKEGGDGLTFAIRRAPGLHCLSFGENPLG